MTFEQFITKALLVPFVEKGRSWDGWDCWGMYRLSCSSIFGIDLPEYLDYDSTQDYLRLKELIDSGRSMFKPVELKRAILGDAALFTVSGIPCHIAMMTDAKHALHAEKKLGTFIESIYSAMWIKRLEGIYRLCPMP